MSKSLRNAINCRENNFKPLTPTHPGEAVLGDTGRGREEEGRSTEAGKVEGGRREGGEKEEGRPEGGLM